MIKCRYITVLLNCDYARIAARKVMNPNSVQSPLPDIRHITTLLQFMFVLI